MSELIILIMLLIIIFGIVTTYHIFEINGMYYLFILFVILSYIMSFKIITILGVNINLSSITYASIFTIIYIILEKGTKKDIKKIKEISIITSFITIIAIVIMNLYMPSVNDIVSTNIKGLIMINFKHSISFFITLVMSVYLTIYLYNELKKVRVNILLNVILNYIIISFLTVILFFLISYFNVLELKEIIYLITSNFVFRFVIILLNIPIIYNIKKIRRIKL